MLALVVEDDPEIALAVRQALESVGGEAHCAEDAESGLGLALRTRYDVILVDLMLPGLDGISMIEQLRKQEVNSPIIVLSAKRSTEDKVTCLRRGADDYISKPFDVSELLARLEAVLRRTQPAADTEKVEADGVVIDLLNRTARRDGVRIELRPREFALLELLMRNKGRPLSKSYLIERLWEYHFTPQTNLVDVLVCRLRNSVDRDHPVKLIQTIRGTGYVFGAT